MVYVRSTAGRVQRSQPAMRTSSRTAPPFAAAVSHKKRSVEAGPNASDKSKDTAESENGSGFYHCRFYGPGTWVRTCGLMHPKRISFIFVANNRQLCCICFLCRYFCSLLIVVRLSVLSLVMVKNMVKNADSPLPISGSGEYLS